MKNILKILLAALLAAFVIGCSNPGVSGSGYVEELEVPTIDYNIDKLRSIPYMGGSLIYNSTDKSSNHLFPGMKIPFRLGEVEVVYEAEIQEDSFVDVENRAKFGYLTIKSIDGEEISFTYVIYNSEGERVRKSSLRLSKGEKADLDKDGDLDITFAAPSRIRAGFENVTLLKFLSSQIEKSTSMYSLLEEQFADNSYPAGIMGLNPDEALLLNSNSIPTRSRSVVEGDRLGSFETSGSKVINQGDFVLNTGTGEYSAVSNVSLTRSGASVELDYSEKEKTVLDALPLLYFNYDSIVDVTNSMSLDSNGQTRGEIANFPGYKSKTLFNISKKFKLAQGVYAELKNLKGQIGLKASGSISWKRVEGEIKVAFYISTSVYAEANRSYQVSKKLFHETFRLKRIIIPVGPVVFTLGANAIVGADLNFKANGVAKYGFDTGALAGAYASAYIGLKKRTRWWHLPQFTSSWRSGLMKDYYFRVTTRPTVKANANANIKLYGGLEGEATLMTVLYVKTSIRPYVQPGINGKLSNKRLTVTGTLDAGVDAGDLKIGIKIWKLKKEKRFGDIFKYSRRLWTKILYKNY